MEDHDAHAKASSYHTISVTVSEWEEAINSVVASNDIAFVTSADDNGTRVAREGLFNVDQDDPIRASVAEVEGILDPDILGHALNESLAMSNFWICAGSTVVSLGEDDLFTDLPDVLAAHAENPRGVNKELLSKIWRISHQRQIPEVR